MNLVLVLEQRSSTTHFPYFMHNIMSCGCLFKSMGIQSWSSYPFSHFQAYHRGRSKISHTGNDLLIRKSISNNQLKGYQFKDNVDYLFHLTTWSEQAYSFYTYPGSTDITVQFAPIQTEIRMIRHNPVKRIFQSLMSVNWREKA